jgi:hypothetical protein
MIIDPKSFYDFYTKTCEDWGFKPDSYEDILYSLSTMLSQMVETLWKNDREVGAMCFNCNGGPYLVVGFENGEVKYTLAKNKPEAFNENKTDPNKEDALTFFDKVV